MKRLLPILVASSLVFVACSKGDGPTPEKQIEEVRTPEQISLAKIKKAIPELASYATIGFNQVSANGDLIVGGLATYKYLFAIISAEEKVITKAILPLETEAKGKYKVVTPVPVKEYDDLFYFSLSEEKDFFYPGYMRLLNIVDGEVYVIGKIDSGIERLEKLRKAFSTISFVGKDKLWVYSVKGELLNSLSTYDLGDGGANYVIINKDQVVSILSGTSITFTCLNLHKPFGDRTTVWRKSYPITTWQPKRGENYSVDSKLSDDKENVIVSFTIGGKRYDPKGDLQDFSETGSIKVNKITGDLVK